MSEQGFKGKISIKPYINAEDENMGLENYNYVVFPNTFQVESLAAIEQNGKSRYLNGLNEFAPEIKMIQDKDKKAAVIKDIRQTVSVLEQERNYNLVKIDDEDFWSKIEMFKPDNGEIWGKVTVRLGNDEIFLDPKKKMEDLMLVKAIENGGFSLIAKSFDDARAQKKKWYLDRQIDSVSAKITVTKLRNQALALLQTIYEDEPRRLFYIAKNIDINSIQYSNSTMVDQIYENLDKFINGASFDKDVRRCANLFIESTELSKEDIKIKAIIKDCVFYKYIFAKSDSVLYESTQNIMLGRNVAEVLEFLKNPANDDVLDLLMAKTETLWKA